MDEHPVRLAQGAGRAFGVDLQVRLPVEDGQGEPQSEHGDRVADQRLPCFPLVALHFLRKEETRDGQENPGRRSLARSLPLRTGPVGLILNLKRAEDFGHLATGHRKGASW